MYGQYNGVLTVIKPFAEALVITVHCSFHGFGGMDGRMQICKATNAERGAVHD